MMNIRFAYIIAASFVVCASCAAERTIEVNSTVPSEAIGMQTKVLRVEKGMRSPPIRTEYQLESSYQNSDVIKFYDESLSAYGWTLCHRTAGEKYEWIWEDYLIHSPEGQDKTIHQIFKYLVNAAESEIISVRIYYIESVGDGSEVEMEWSNKNRFFDVTHYKFTQKRYSEIMELYSEIGLACSN